MTDIGHLRACMGMWDKDAIAIEFRIYMAFNIAHPVNQTNSGNTLSAFRAFGAIMAK